jgi:hypothetical protein
MLDRSNSKLSAALALWVISSASRVARSNISQGLEKASA